METKTYNASCSICGRGYHICISCRDNMKNKPWQMHTDTSEHYKIYQIIHGFSTGVYTKEEAKSKMKAVDLSDMDCFRDHIKEIILTILHDDSVSIADVTESLDTSVIDKSNMVFDFDTPEENMKIHEYKNTRRRKSSAEVETEKLF